MNRMQPVGPRLSAETLHSSTVAKDDRAVLITGPSGSGKSDLALRLLDRGFTLVSDDQTVVRREENRLIASAPATIAGKLEIRGLGIVQMETTMDVPVMLINGGTAGEAELVAGALHDSHRAVLLGSKSFGESAIETVVPIKDHCAIRLTTGRFLTPNGGEIEGKGIEPDLSVSPLKLQKVAETDRLREADLHGALKNPDAEKAAEKAAETKSPGTEAPEKSEETAAPPKGDQPTVASKEIGTHSDEQLSEAIDVLRGLALSSGRTASAAR